jgi:hypothetical protein
VFVRFSIFDLLLPVSSKARLSLLLFYTTLLIYPFVSTLEFTMFEKNSLFFPKPPK